MPQPSAGCSFALLQRQADCPECSINVWWQGAWERGEGARRKGSVPPLGLQVPSPVEVGSIVGLFGGDAVGCVGASVHCASGTS